MNLRGASLIEVLVVCAIAAVLASLVVIPAYDRFARARAVDDAAEILAQDVGLLERFAQNSAPFEGATIEVESEDPLQYSAYSGRPRQMDPQSHIVALLFERRFSDVRLIPGALGRNSAMLFARNGSVQYIAGGQWADQHNPVLILLQSTADTGRQAVISIDPFSGSVSAEAVP
jgi:Tfp pilus assembly protein PilE